MSKNTMWIMLMVVAAFIGAFMGPAIFDGFAPGTVLMISLVFILLFVGYIIWALSSNRGAAKADDAAQADAKAMRPSPGKGRLYITRRGFVAALQGMNVTIDGVGSGQIKSGQMLMAELAPGNYRIHVGTAKASLAKPAEIDVAVEAGTVTVVDAMLEMGALKGSIKLSKLDAQGAQDNVKATKLMLWESAPA